MISEEKIRSYIPFVDFFADIMGPNTEVVLHNVKDREHSLLAIRNGGISGHEAGADLANRLLHQEQLEDKNYVTNYLGRSGGGGKLLKSSTFFIRDDEGGIIGALGVNTDISAISEVHRILGEMVKTGERHEDVDSGKAGDPISIRDMVLSVIDQVLSASVIEPSRMTTEEKKDIVDELNAKGVFLLKGTVAEVAARLEVSEQTIYRYLK